jgi:hypothetical protein
VAAASLRIGRRRSAGRRGAGASANGLRGYEGKPLRRKGPFMTRTPTTLRHQGFWRVGVASAETISMHRSAEVCLPSS